MGEVQQTANLLRQAAADAEAEFGGMSAGQLNWKPGEKEWSIAQCLDHLIVTHSLYFPLFERFAAGNTEMSFFERVSPFSGFFGRFLIRGLDPKNLKKMKTTGRAQPAASRIDGDIIEHFREHQNQLAAAIEDLPADLDAEKQIITSPLMGLITYSLADALTFIPMHCRRHLDQARRVTEAEGFPK